MREIPTRTAQVAADMEIEPVIMGEPIDWPQRYNKLQALYMGAMHELDHYKHPVWGEDVVERELLAVRQFLDSMPSAEGAVTSSNVYNAAFFQRPLDHKFVVKLCRGLLERFAPHQSLIQSTFDLWMNNAK